MNTYDMLAKVTALKELVSHDQIFDFTTGVMWLKTLMDISDKILAERDLKACDRVIGFENYFTDNEKVQKITELLEYYTMHSSNDEVHFAIRRFLGELRSTIQDVICGKCFYSHYSDIQECWENCKSHFFSPRWKHG